MYAMYADFMSEVAEFLINAQLATPETLVGYSDVEIADMESCHRGSFPCAYVMFLKAMGYSAGNVYDLNIGSKGWDDAHQFAEGMASDRLCPFKLTPTMVPISQHEGYHLRFFDNLDGDDPKIYSYLEGDGSPSISWPTFTCFIREAAISAAEHSPWLNEILREISAHRERWMQRKAVLDQYSKETSAIRVELQQRVAEFDAVRHEITGPTEFQALWNVEIQKHDVYRVLLGEGKRIPWGWLTPKQAAVPGLP